MTTDFQFAWSWVLLAAPLPALVYWLLSPEKGAAGALRVPFYPEVSAITADGRGVGARGRLLLMTLLWLLLLLAAARPQWLGPPAMLELSGRDLMLAVDVSGSMKATDMVHERRPENRLSAVKRVAGEFIRGRSGDRVGLILFGSRAYLQAPLSLDRQTVDQLLQESAIGIAGERTAIGDAIGLALKRLQDRPGSEKLLILLTDGANTTGQMAPRRAAELAHTGGMKIHTIGVGSGSGGLPGLLGGRLRGPGDELDEATLQYIAQTTGGRYFGATDGETLEQIYALIDRLEPVAENEERFRPVVELFHWPLAVVMACGLCWALWTGLPGRRRRDPAGVAAPGALVQGDG